MSDQRRQRRGRPKGTGINDWERLLAIASIIEKDPKLKVTTAIRQLGFSDPSVIRRLRDKFKVNRDLLLRNKAVGATDQPQSYNPTRKQLAEILNSKPSTGLENQRQKTAGQGETITTGQPETQKPRSSATDYIALGAKSSAVNAHFQSDTIRCLLLQSTTMGSSPLAGCAPC